MAQARSYISCVESSLQQKTLDCCIIKTSPKRVSKTRIAYFDVQTTGFPSEDSEVVQIGCVIGEKTFCVYIKPTSIPPLITKINKFELVSNQLCYKGVKLETKPEDLAWRSFSDFLVEHSPVLLVGHNIIRFDAVFLLRYLQKYDLLEKLRFCINGISDTLVLLRRIERDLPSYKLRDLAVRFLEVPDFEDAAFDAVYHNKVLQVLLLKLEISEETLLENRVPFPGFSKNQTYQIPVSQNKRSLYFLRKHVSDYMLTKLAKQNVNFEELFKRFRKGTLTIILSGVTKDKKIINKIMQACEAEFG